MVRYPDQNDGEKAEVVSRRDNENMQRRENPLNPGPGISGTVAINCHIKCFLPEKMQICQPVKSWCNADIARVLIMIKESVEVFGCCIAVKSQSTRNLFLVPSSREKM
jgi:hypothetical protein